MKGCGCGWAVDVGDFDWQDKQRVCGEKGAIYNIVFIYANKSGRSKNERNEENRKKTRRNARKEEKQKMGKHLNECVLLHQYIIKRKILLYSTKQTNKQNKVIFQFFQSGCLHG